MARALRIALGILLLAVLPLAVVLSSTLPVEASGHPQRRRMSAPAPTGFSPPSSGNLQFWVTTEVPASITTSGGFVTNWQDQSANAFNASAIGNPEFVSGGGPNGHDAIKLGLAAASGGAILSYANSANLNTSTAVTLIAICEEFSGPQFAVWFGKFGSYFEGYAIGNHDSVSGRVLGWEGAYYNKSSNYVLPASTWVFLAFRYDGSNLSFWHDGTALADVSQTGAITTGTSALTLGGYNGGGNANISCVEFAMYNSALSSGDIATWHTHSQTDYLTP